MRIFGRWGLQQLHLDAHPSSSIIEGLPWFAPVTLFLLLVLHPPPKRCPRLSKKTGMQKELLHLDHLASLTREQSFRLSTWGPKEAPTRASNTRRYTTDFEYNIINLQFPRFFLDVHYVQYVAIGDYPSDMGESSGHILLIFVELYRVLLRRCIFPEWSRMREGFSFYFGVWE